MVPISAMQSEEKGALFTYVAARRLERVRVFQLGVQGLEDRGRVDEGGGLGLRLREVAAAAAVEILASEVHAVRGALGCQIHLLRVSQRKSRLWFSHDSHEVGGSTTIPIGRHRSEHLASQQVLSLMQRRFFKLPSAVPRKQPLRKFLMNKRPTRWGTFEYKGHL